MNLFSDWDDDTVYDDWSGCDWLFRDDNNHPDGHPDSAYKDDGDMKLFKEN